MRQRMEEIEFLSVVNHTLILRLSAGKVKVKGRKKGKESEFSGW